MKGPWVEFYRPSKIEDLILPEKKLNIIKGILNKNNIPNMTLASKNPGIGKTTIALLLAHTISGKDNTLFINCSLDRNIDTVRNEMSEFVFSGSMEGTKKCIVLDEIDYSNQNSTQPALRNFIEEFSNNCSFIFTCNYPEKIIEPLLSRCPIFNIDANTTDEKRQVAYSILSRCKYILDTENIVYDEKILPPLIKTYYPDIRRIINELQTYSMTGSVTYNVIPNEFNLQDNDINELLNIMKLKDFNSLRRWVHNNYEKSDIYIRIYDEMYNVIKPEYKNDFILTVADYNYKSSIATCPEITLAALVTEIMSKGV